jgi:uncharacterized protein
MSLTGLVLAVLIGVTLGLLGGGGSILTVPVFVYLLGYAAKPAIATSLAVVGATSLFAAIHHARINNIDARAALWFAPCAMLGTFVGTKFATMLDGTTQLLIFAAVMLTSALLMLRDQNTSEQLSSEPILSEQSSLKPFWTLAVTGLGVGLMTGLVGVGGGFLIVPALVLFAGLPMKRAVGTSLVVIALNSLIGLFGSVQTIRLDWPLIAAFVMVATAGSLIGARLVQMISAAVLRRSFGVFLLCISAFIFFQNRATFNLEMPSRAASQTHTH